VAPRHDDTVAAVSHLPEERGRAGRGRRVFRCRQPERTQCQCSGVDTSVPGTILPLCGAQGVHSDRVAAGVRRARQQRQQGLRALPIPPPIPIVLLDCEEIDRPLQHPRQPIFDPIPLQASHRPRRQIHGGRTLSRCSEATVGTLARCQEGDRWLEHVEVAEPGGCEGLHGVEGIEDTALVAGFGGKSAVRVLMAPKFRETFAFEIVR
jgi:hypothetical protein